MLTAGVDEVGRGPLAGPVLAAAVILDPNHPIEGLADSKKLSEKKRLYLSEVIKEKSLSWAFALATVQEIDEHNILQASLIAMSRAVEKLHITPNKVLVDGNQIPKVKQRCQAIVGGDQTVPEISAASIVAKVMRDQMMIELDKEYPGYGFAQHKGYPTAIHLKALEALGVTPIHRLSFAPVRKWVLSHAE